MARHLTMKDMSSRKYYFTESEPKAHSGCDIDLIFPRIDLKAEEPRIISSMVPLKAAQL